MSGARRDSWDVLNKTKGVLSNNSLESLNNLTEKQLSTSSSTLTATRGVADKETERNTQFNKFSLANLNSGATTTSSSNKYTTSGVTSTTMREESRYVTKQEANNNFSFATSRLSSFKPIAGGELTGAKAIKVQDIPDGVLGRPVEFESEFWTLELKDSRFHIFPSLVDGSRAGSGNLEILVNGGRVTSSVRALGGQKFIASFTPHESGTHVVQITFNGETVPGEFNVGFAASFIPNKQLKLRALCYCLMMSLSLCTYLNIAITSTTGSRSHVYYLWIQWKWNNRQFHSFIHKQKPV